MIVKMNELEYRLYCEFQKEFGLLGKIKEGAANMFDKWANKESDLMKKAMKESTQYKVNNPEARKNLYKKANEQGSRVIGGVDRNMLFRKQGNQGPGTLRLNKGWPNNLKKNIEKSVKEIDKWKPVYATKTHRKLGREKLSRPFFGEDGKFISNLDQVQMNRTSKRLKTLKKGIERNKHQHLTLFDVKEGDAALAHELGHFENLIGTGLKKTLEEKARTSKSKGWWKNQKDIWNEKNASKNALKMMKEAGYTKEELKTAKKGLDKALETYKRGRDKDLFRKIAKTIRK